MSRVFCHELKRLCLNRKVWVLSVLSVLFSILLVYVVISNTYYSLPDKPNYRHGLDAITHEKTIYAPSCGLVTPEKLQHVLKVYQETASAYPGGVTPDAVHEEKLAPLSPILNLLLLFYETPHMPVENAADFYKQRDAAVQKEIENQYPDSPAVQNAAIAINQRIETPFYYAYGYGDSDGPEFLVFLLFVLVFFCTLIAAPVFSEDYHSRADDIQRCSRYGRWRLGTARVLAVYVVVLLLMLVCSGIYLVSLNAVFGWEGLKASVQVSYFTTAITPTTTGGAAGATVLSGVLTLLATVSCTMFVSSRCKNPVAAVAASVGIILLPLFYSFLFTGSGWFISLLPSAAIVAGNSFYRTLVENSLMFLHIGSFVLWLPAAYILFAAVEIPLFGLLAVWSYKRQEVC